MRVYSYVVAYDFGFAPNPFHGVCTLATCKPSIRRAAKPGDWVVGTGAKSNDLEGTLVYAMRVGSSISFDEYWKDPRYAIKRPVVNGSLKLLYGDNIYHHDAKGNWAQAESHHSWPGGRRHLLNLERDTSVDRVLIADWFVYYGGAAIPIPNKLRSRLYIGRQGHTVIQEPEAHSVADWLLGLEPGLMGFPAKHTNHPKILLARGRR